MSYSPDFKINVNKLNAEEALLPLLTISHPFLSEPVRLVNDTKDFVLNGETYLAMPYTISRQSDVQGELPKVSLRISNVGKAIMKWIDSSGGGRDAEIKISLARRSSQLVEEEISFGIQSVNVTTEVVSFNLIIQDNLSKRAVRWDYNKKWARGLF